MKLQPGHNSCPVDREIKFSENILHFSLLHSKNRYKIKKNGDAAGPLGDKGLTPRALIPQYLQ